MGLGEILGSCKMHVQSIIVTSVQNHLRTEETCRDTKENTWGQSLRKSTSVIGAPDHLPTKVH